MLKALFLRCPGCASDLGLYCLCKIYKSVTVCKSKNEGYSDLEKATDVELLGQFPRIHCRYCQL